MLVLKKITPTFNHVLTTNDVYEKDVKEKGLIVDLKGTPKRYQKVLAVGPLVKCCKPGDIVMIDFIRYGKRIHRNGKLAEGAGSVMEDDPTIAYSIPVIKIEGKECLFLGDNDIQFIIDEYEEREDPPQLFVDEPRIIGA